MPTCSGFGPTTSDSEAAAPESAPPGEGEQRIRAATIGEPQRLDGPVELRPHDPAWARQYEVEAARVMRVLGDRALRIEHVGSTSIPGIAAKPIIDMLLVVGDSAAEADYVPAMEQAGYVLRIREPDWHQHRLFKGPDANINLHVFTAGCPEIDRMVDFRDHLRVDAADRTLYARTKEELSGRTWNYVQEYADAKTEVVEAIIARVKRTSRRPLSQRPRRAVRRG